MARLALTARVKPAFFSQVDHLHNQSQPIVESATRKALPEPGRRFAMIEGARQ